jgi:hypothetical protein
MPKIVICSTADEAKLCEAKGVAYVIWKKDVQILVKMVMLQYLEKIFPYIKWRERLGIHNRLMPNVVCPGNASRTTAEKMGQSDGSEHMAHASSSDPRGQDVDGIRVINAVGAMPNVEAAEVPIDEYVGTSVQTVDIEVLQGLKLLPEFIGDIMENVRNNLVGSAIWSEGYNKRLDCLAGNFARSENPTNLIILDISYSIPLEIANTMLALIDTLRIRADAHLIITSESSGYYPKGAELPAPEKLRALYGRSNESTVFKRILKENIAGMDIGNLICFGDSDMPYIHEECIHTLGLNTITVRKVHNYFRIRSGYHENENRKCGYGQWADMTRVPPEHEYNTAWVRDVT